MGKIPKSVLAGRFSIGKLIEELNDKLVKGQAKNTEKNDLVTVRDALDNNNADFKEVHEDKFSNFLNYSYLLTIFFSAFIDYIMLYNAVAIMTKGVIWAHYLKVFIPLLIIFLEMIVSYVCQVKERTGELRTWLGKSIQYFVLALLAGLCAMTCFYFAAGYSYEFDNISFTQFFTGIVIYQAILLVASILLHIWLIQNAENIVTAFAYILYKTKRDKITRKINDITRINRDVYTPQFKKMATRLVKEIRNYNDTHPLYPYDFKHDMSDELMNAINTVMGRVIFKSNGNSNGSISDSAQ
jgi:hypothetical protein